MYFALDQEYKRGWELASMVGVFSRESFDTVLLDVTSGNIDILVRNSLINIPSNISIHYILKLNFPNISERYSKPMKIRTSENITNNSTAKTNNISVIKSEFNSRKNLVH